mmetsp:Transcript_16788/g.23486  ORF Transcript_16788/g.23486 Transcript_16788/m.23486 type:complete len:234 (-) Transcript_16788:296-997(-)|eukprot:CAMPEP_0185268248 /NCGR_PEP_ID=MMETSP1359-20130426/36574_1 /TAXON_ID=552665 /ORGANISM="Bigelowiella longifila, Strain CCMP242" /LENGTH=233 /DNA_ID=CAMNT_0027858935 /DNA_START=70 /DNA_END=771 /DNA_ORIENTATION=+
MRSMSSSLSTLINSCGGCSCSSFTNPIYGIRRRLATSPSTNPYHVLGLPYGASREEVKQSYFKLAKTWHPDINPTEAAQATFRRITAAYNELLPISPKESKSDDDPTSNSYDKRRFWSRSSGGKFRKVRGWGWRSQEQWTYQDSKLAQNAKQSWNEKIRAEANDKRKKVYAEELNRLFLSLVPPHRLSTYELRSLSLRLGLPSELRRTQLIKQIEIVIKKNKKTLCGAAIMDD